LIGVSQFGKEGAVKDTAVAGLGTGLALSLAGVPVPAAISVGLLAGLTHYSDAVERQAKRIQDADIAQALSDITAQIKLSGDRLSPASLGAGRGLFGRLSEAQGRVNKELGTGQVIGKTVSRLFGEVITLEAFDRIFSGEVNRQTISTADQTRNLVRKERQDAFNEALNASTDDILAFRQAILESGVRSLQDFKGYADGFGAQLLEVGKLADANFEQSTAKLIEAANIAKGRQIRLSAVAAQGSRLALGVAGRIPNATGLGTAGFGNAVRGLGLDAQTSGTLRGVNAAAFALPRILASGRFSENFAAEIGTALRQAGIGDSVVNAVTAQLETVSFDDFNESLGNLQQTSDKLLSSFDPLVQQTERLIEVQKELVEKRNQELSQFVTNRAGLVDARERATLAALGSRENALRLRGRPLSTDAGNAIAVGSAISLAGTADVSQLGANLKTLTDAFKATEDSRYLESITLVTKALEKLSDTTLRTRNIEEELNKARSSKEAKLRFAEGFFSSDLRGRLELAKSLAAARKAVAVGDLSKLTPRESAAAIAGLRAVEGIKLGATGKTGRELLDDLLVKSTKGLVTREDTTIEELTRKSILITTDAAKASRELAISQERIFANFVALLSAENKTFLDGLARLFARGRASGGIVSGPGSSTSDSIPARLSNGEYVMSAAAVNRIGVGNLDAMNFARGGRVYRDRFQRSALRALARSTRVGAITDARMAVASGTIYSPFTGRSYGGSPMGSRYKFIDDPGFAPVRPLAASRAFRRGYATGGYVSGGSAGLPSGLVAQFSSGVLTLANAVNNLSQIRIPEQITMSATMKHEVVLNGASVLTQLQPALLAIVDQAIGETLRKHISLQQRLEQPV
jgi:hypothetical protein